MSGNSNGALAAFKAKVVTFVVENSRRHEEYKLRGDYLGLQSWSEGDRAARAKAAESIARDRARLGVSDALYDAILQEAMASLQEGQKDESQPQ